MKDTKTKRFNSRQRLWLKIAGVIIIAIGLGTLGALFLLSASVIFYILASVLIVVGIALAASNDVFILTVLALSWMP